MSSLAKRWMLVAAVLGALSVVLGAFAAHALPDYLQTQGAQGADLERRLANFETAARYQTYAALFLLVMALAVDRHPRRTWQVACWSMLGGVLLFAGALYGVAVAPAEMRSWFGPVAPIGGVGMIAAWAAAGIGAVLPSFPSPENTRKSA